MSMPDLTSMVLDTHAARGDYENFRARLDEALREQPGYDLSAVADSESGETLLHSAILGSDPRVIRTCVSLGCAVNKPISCGGDYDGMYPIHFASSARGAASVVTLVALGADPNALYVPPGGDYRQTALMMAIEFGSGSTTLQRKLEHAAALLACGADPEVLDHQGRTALIYAVERCDPDFVDLLLSFGADPDAGDYEGQTARQLLAGEPERSVTRTALAGQMRQLGIDALSGAALF